MAKKAKEKDPCLIYFALLVLGIAVYLIVKIVQFFKRPDALAQIGNFLAVIGLCIGSVILFFMVLSAGSRLNENIKNERMIWDTQRMLKRVKRLCLQRKGKMPFLTREVLFSLAEESRFRSDNVVVGDPLGPDPSIPYNIKYAYYIPPYWEQVDALMETYIDHFNEVVKPDSVPEADLKKLVEELMTDFYKIHPFHDKNKRAAMALGELAAMKYGYFIKNDVEVKLHVQELVMGEASPGADSLVELEQFEIDP